MKRFLSVLAAAFLLGTMANAQKLSWNFSAGYISSDCKVSSASFDFNGAYAGIGVDFPIGDKGLAFAPAINWDYKKLSFLVFGDADLHYLRIPLHVKFNVPFGETARFFVSGGPSVNIGMFGSTSLNSEYDYLIDEDEKNGPLFGKDGMKRIHLQAGLAIGVVFSDHYMLKASYDIGITKGADMSYTNRVDAITIGCGYCF